MGLSLVRLGPAQPKCLPASYYLRSTIRGLPCLLLLLQSSSGVESMAAWSSSPSLRHLLLLRPRVPLGPTCLAGSFSRRHVHSHSRRRLFSSASSSTLTHGDEASTHVDADGVVDVNPPRGTRDFPPEDMRLRTWLFDQFREVSRLMAFEEVDFPVLESEALFIRKAGEEITQQVSSFLFSPSIFCSYHRHCCY